MSSRYQASTSSSLSLSSDLASHDHLPSSAPREKAWVDPAALPHYGHASAISGNAPDYVKQLNYNTFMCYGVGQDDSFGYQVGKSVKFVEVNVNRKRDRNERLEATTIAEVTVTKRELSFLL